MTARAIAGARSDLHRITGMTVDDQANVDLYVGFLGHKRV